MQEGYTPHVSHVKTGNHIIRFSLLRQNIGHRTVFSSGSSVQGVIFPEGKILFLAQRPVPFKIEYIFVNTHPISFRCRWVKERTGNGVSCEGLYCEMSSLGWLKNAPDRSIAGCSQKWHTNDGINHMTVKAIFLPCSHYMLIFRLG